MIPLRQPSELERARDRIAELEELLGLRERLPVALGLTPFQTRIIGVFTKRRYASVDTMICLAFGADADMGDPKNTIDVQLCHARRPLRQHGIEIKTVWGQGWMIEKDDQRRLIALLDQEQIV